VVIDILTTLNVSLRRLMTCALKIVRADSGSKIFLSNADVNRWYGFPTFGEPDPPTAT
jgi:hypothetical protein